MVCGVSGTLLATDIGLMRFVVAAWVDRDVVSGTGSRREAFSSSRRPGERRRH